MPEQKGVVRADAIGSIRLSRRLPHGLTILLTGQYLHCEAVDKDDDRDWIII
jgi:hypothetical protein